MLKIENTAVYGWEAAIRGMRNPMNSWDMSDSMANECGSECTRWNECGAGYKCPVEYSEMEFFMVGKDDLKLMRSLVKAGTDHSKFMRMINVTCDIIAPLYWWKEACTYRIGVTMNSCSTMHKIHAKEFTLDDFSHEHLVADGMYILQEIINVLNDCRDLYQNYDTYSLLGEFDPKIASKKDVWWQMIQLLPSSYNQRRTVQLNYQVLRNIYHARRNHKLDEWHTFCEWIETLPYSELITGKDGQNE